MDKWLIIAFVLALIAHRLTHADNIITIDGDDLEGPNVCKRITTYNVSVTVTVMVPYTEIKSEWCAAIPPRCRKSYVRMKAENRTEVHSKTRALRECCDGYRENQQKNRCIPHCKQSCGNGTCIEPNICKCDKGYGGPNCNIHCPPGYYGTKCKKKCDCANDATCDPYDGVCHCQKGYQGTKCELTCTPEFYGEGCSEVCRCVNGGKCNHISGECYCKEGFTGPLCEEPCKIGNANCKTVCRCQNGGICDEDLQTCKCPPGWTGKVCANRCQPGFFGANCSQVCECFNGATCDHVFGQCICEPGFMGQKCLDQCPYDKYGVNCTHECSCKNGGTCDKSTGYCHCSPGWKGLECEERICPDDRFGEQCENQCECVNDNTKLCHPHDGSCVCKAGWSSATCNRPCQFFKYGEQCANTCDCRNNAQCLPTNGTCVCPIGYTGDKCELKCPKGTYGQDCSQRCECKNGAECKEETGQCFCKPGWSGFHCERPCNSDSYGQDCKEKCDCQNNGSCNPITGVCYCAPGWIGSKCETKCEEWKFGHNCSFDCLCKHDNTLACDHQTGKCFCKTESRGGQTIKYSGVKCESLCPLGFYGRECHHQCNCKNNSSCDPDTGECFCERGWTGNSCDQKCPNGYFGLRCEERCKEEENMSPRATCDHVTGEQKCRAGYVGITCEHPCKSGTYGEDCKKECHCEHGGECSHIDGICHCLPGWQGDHCEEPCVNGTWGVKCTHSCSCANEGKCRPSDGQCICPPGFMEPKCEEVCPEGYFGLQCVQPCNCKRNSNFICHPVNGCVCKAGFVGSNCDQRIVEGQIQEQPENGENFASNTSKIETTLTPYRYTFIPLDKIETTSSRPQTEATHLVFIPLEKTTTKNYDINHDQTRIDFIVTSSSVSSTPFTFLPLDVQTTAASGDEQKTSLKQNDKNSNESTSTAFTFVPLDTTTSLMITEAANDILKTSTILNTNINDATSVYITNDIPEVTLSASATEMKYQTDDVSENFDSTTEMTKDQQEKITTEIINLNSQPGISVENSEKTSESINYRKDRKFPLKDDVTSEMTTSPILTPKTDEIPNTTNTYDKETTNDIKSTLTLNNESTYDDSNSIDPHATFKPSNDYSIATSLESSTESLNGESSTNLENTLKLLTSTTIDGITRFDSEYLHDRQTSVMSEIDDTKTAKTDANKFYNYLLINATKNGNETNWMEHKLEKDEPAVNSSGMIWGIFCTILFLSIIMALLLYYRRRVANLKAEIGHVVRYMSDDPRNFDNPVYSYQATSVNTDTSTLLNRNGRMNNFNPSRPHNIPLNNFDNASNSSGRAAAYSLQYDPELMNQKNHEADLTNPNLYSSIDDHLYDEIKLKCAELDMEYDHLDYSRPLQPIGPHYHRATSSSMSANSPPDRESQQSNNRFPTTNEGTYNVPIPNPKKLNIPVPVPPLPDRTRNNTHLTPSPSSSTASTITQDDNIDAIISVEKPMNKDLNSGKAEEEELVMNPQQTDANNKLE